MGYDDPYYFYQTHSHDCVEPGCKTRVGCAARPERDEDGSKHCPFDNEPFLCEDHREMEPCAWCGAREPQDFTEFDGDRMHPKCAKEAEGTVCSSCRALVPPGMTLCTECHTDKTGTQRDEGGESG